MTAGTELRTRTENGGILGPIAITEIHIEREKITGSATFAAPKRAYILRSLKQRDDLQDLRDVYGEGFIAISAYSPKEKRERALTDLLAKSGAKSLTQHLELVKGGSSIGRRSNSGPQIFDVAARGQSARLDGLLPKLPDSHQATLASSSLNAHVT
jgi:hypothetical protein